MILIKGRTKFELTKTDGLLEHLDGTWDSSELFHYVQGSVNR